MARFHIVRTPCVCCGNPDVSIVVNMKYWICFACYSITPGAVAVQIENVKHLSGFKNED